MAAGNAPGGSRVDACLASSASGLPVTANAVAVSEYLGSAGFSPAAVIDTGGAAMVLDLSAGSLALGEPLQSFPVQRFSELLQRALANAGCRFAFGRYGEHRELYNNQNFHDAGSGERRSIHMGVDLFCAAGTAVCAPLNAEVVVVANNAAELDYGPMLILRHSTDSGDAFYTLYGHLDPGCLAQMSPGRQVAAGERIAAVGSPPENGNWPPHLHFQIILDLLELGADFPGVAAPGQRDAWLALSPSPAPFFPECDPAALNCDVSGAG